MIKRVLFIPLAVLALSQCGCVTTGQDRLKAEMRSRVEIDNLSLKVQRLEERVEGLQESQQQLYREIEAARTQARADTGRLTTAVAGLESEIKAADAARQQLRKEMVAELSGKMETIIRSHAPRNTQQVGRRHIVESGQTVSEIAAAYKVTVAAIVKANNLNDAGMIRVGQSLFIPE